MNKMRDNGNHGSDLPAGRRDARGAFTLIEMLVVICILMILAALIIAVSRYVMESSANKKTVAIEAVIISAVQAYYDKNKAYPDSDDSSGDITKLYTALLPTTPDPKVMDRLRLLPKEAAEANVFKDSWGRNLRYYKTGGLGGGPVIVSAGPDGTFDNADDIRSDTAK